MVEVICVERIDGVGRARQWEMRRFWLVAFASEFRIANLSLLDPDQIGIGEVRQETVRNFAPKHAPTIKLVFYPAHSLYLHNQFSAARNS